MLYGEPPLRHRRAAASASCIVHRAHADTWALLYSGHDGEVDDHSQLIALHIAHGERIAESLVQLIDQRQRIMVVDETHHLAGLQRTQRAEGGGMAETTRDAASVEDMDGFTRKRRCHVRPRLNGPRQHEPRKPGVSMT